MALQLSKHHFCVVGNARLAFFDSRSQVESFISARLRHHSVGSHEFVTDWGAIDARVEELCGDRTGNVECIVIVDVAVFHDTMPKSLDCPVSYTPEVYVPESGYFLAE